MARVEAETDIWVSGLFKEANIVASPQGSGIKEINDALKTASKKLNGQHGAPDFIGVSKDFLIVVENKKSIREHEIGDLMVLCLLKQSQLKNMH